MNDTLIYKRERIITSAFIDSTVKLGITGAALIVQDNLTECFSMLGCDGIVFREKYSAFWVFTKTRIRFINRPSWRKKVDAVTFPIDSAAMRTRVNTVLSDENGDKLILANQEACVLNIKTRKPVMLSSLPYPAKDFPPALFDEPFEKFSNFQTNAVNVYEQTVHSQHIDMSHHTNNIEYIKFALNVFSDDYLESHDITLIEAHYTGESCEGQHLNIYRADNNKDTFIFIKEGSRTVFEMKVSFKEN